MQVTDTDRREVASRLRECEPYMSAFPFADYVGRAVDPAGSIETWREVCLRLADLIDPTCLACPDVEDTPDGGQFGCWSCSACGNIISVDPGYDTETDGPTYCEVCGCRVTGKGEPTWL